MISYLLKLHLPLFQRATQEPRATRTRIPDADTEMKRVLRRILSALGGASRKARTGHRRDGHVGRRTPPARKRSPQRRAALSHGALEQPCANVGDAREKCGRAHGRVVRVRELVRVGGVAQWVVVVVAVVGISTSDSGGGGWQQACWA